MRYPLLLAYGLYRLAVLWTLQQLLNITMSDRTRRDLQQGLRRVFFSLSAAHYGAARIGAVPGALRRRRRSRRAAAAWRRRRLDRRVDSGPDLQLQCLNLLECRGAF